MKPVDRRRFLAGAAHVAAGGWLLPRAAVQTSAAAATDAGPEPIAEPHFPDRLHQFVWRNWELANLDRMALVAKGRASELEAVGRSMGLPPKPPLSADQLRRIYITVIRQNWHLLPNEQLIELLGWDMGKLEFTLKEDDFLGHKLGPKPRCERVVYREPSPQARDRAAEIKKIIDKRLGDDRDEGAEEPFTFIRRLSSTDFAPRRDPSARPAADQVDVTGWKVTADDSVDLQPRQGPGVVRRFEDYLRAAMQSEPGSASGEIRLSADATGVEEAFEVEVGESAVTVMGASFQGLLQGVYWLEDRMEENGGPFIERGTFERKAVFDPRYLYSYFALYGDPLLEPDLDPFPDGYLERLARLGINGVWMQGILSEMAPSKTFPEFGDRHEERLVNLRKLARRVRRSGMGLYLYLNEPRARPAEFFDRRTSMKGAEHGGLHVMCTRIPVVREWISDSVTHIFEQVPELAGVFTITMSENLTNCHSKFRPESCPRCSKLPAADVVGEVLEAIHRGVRRASKTARIIHWDWGWRGEMARELIPTLPSDVRLQSVSEWSIPIRRGGVENVVGEYSISVVGPGPRAKRHWALARKAGVGTQAKTQFNNTWEISAVPYIPVPNLIARHCAGLRREQVNGLMASWTLGGYPSPNLAVAKEFYFAPEQSAGEVLERVARRRYGKAASPGVLKAWEIFSRAFEEFPYGVAIYTIPTQHGPANLLRAKPTGVRGSMILFPQDDYKRWARKYPPWVVASQFSHMSQLWGEGLPLMREALNKAPAARRAIAEEDVAIAEVCYLHFQSVANQVAFYVSRDEGNRDGMRRAAMEEIELATRLYRLARRHSVIGYEATNHYYYRPLDLAEKVLNCEEILGAEG